MGTEKKVNVYMGTENKYFHNVVSIFSPQCCKHLLKKYFQSPYKHLLFFYLLTLILKHYSLRIQTYLYFNSELIYILMTVQI
jgi:hypothetical protein